MPVLIHLTEEMNTLASIIRECSLRAKNSYGAVHTHDQLRQSQCVVCLSEIDLDGTEQLAERHGTFGLALGRHKMQALGAAPVWYLPRGSLVQTKFFETVKRLAYRADPELNHFLWEFTPFVDYPIDAPSEGGKSSYDWRWEREWRVRGDLSFKTTDIEIIFAPEGVHDVIREMWLWEALATEAGLIPPLIDPSWPAEQKFQAIILGRSWAVTDLDVAGNDHGFPADLSSRSEEEALAQAEQREEWAGWLDEMASDDDRDSW